MRYWFRSSRSNRYTRSTDDKNPLYHFQRRLWAAAGGMLLAFLILFANFFHLQYLSYQKYQTQAENNRIAIVPVVPPRGTISDRNGVILAHNFSTFTLEITPEQVPNLDETLRALSEVIDISPRDLRRFRRAMEESRNYISLPLRTRLSDEEVARFAVHKYRFPGVDIEARLYRQYPYTTVASHALGYIGRINERDVEKLKANDEFTNYRGTDHIGKLGVEAAYESILHGTTGWEQVEVDALGRRVRSLSLTPPFAGSSIELTLDIELQKLAEQAMGDHNGAIVAIEPATGEILALVSMPGFDPSLFLEGIDSVNWGILNNSRDKPLLNRALRGAYPPGSTIKPFLALAALQSGKRKPTDAINDPGYWDLNAQNRFRDSKKGGHGWTDMPKSIIESCDTYYYILANETDIDSTAAFLAPFGFGQKTNIDIDGEVKGVLPSRKWKAERYARYGKDVYTWWPGDSISAGIGQGYNAFTPLQLAQATATLAMDGKVYRPHLLKRIISNVTGEPQEVQPELVRQIPLNPRNLEVIKSAMTNVPKHGTSWRAFAKAEYSSAGKTGTAQVFSLKGEKYEAAKLDKYLHDHGLYIAWAPAENPKIALAILVENGGFGASAAAPIARTLLDYYLLKKYPEKKPEKDEKAKAVVTDQKRTE